MSQAIKLIALGLVLCGAGIGCQAQSIQDYSRSQRAVLESDMARNASKALGGQPPAPMPSVVVQANQRQPMLPPPARDRGIIVTGVIELATRAMVELETGGETHLLLKGDQVPGTPWMVASIDQKEVVLKASQSRATRKLPVPGGGL